MGFLSSIFGNDKPRRRRTSTGSSSPTIQIHPIDAGGILSNSEDTSTRDSLNLSFLPVQGPFSFPSPYNTIGCKLTYENSIARSSYSYWNQINNHKGSDILHCVVTINENIHLITLAKSDLTIMNIQNLNIFHSGEGVFFSKFDPNIFFYSKNNKILKFNIVNRSEYLVAEVDENELISQVHSSFDDKVFSGTIRDKNSGYIKDWIVFRENHKTRYRAEGEPDECQIDKSGKWLLIKEDNNNRIINLETEEIYIVPNEGGALGHSDCGFECAIGEDDYNLHPGALVRLNFNSFNKVLLYHTDYWNLGHVSYCCASHNENKCLISPSGDSHSRGRELVSVVLDGSNRCLIICPAMTELWDYENSPKANLCPLGQYAFWTAYVNGRRDAFIVRIPNW